MEGGSWNLAPGSYSIPQPTHFGMATRTDQVPIYVGLAVPSQRNHAYSTCNFIARNSYFTTCQENKKICHTGEDIELSICTMMMDK